jgi:hypothetical protein
VVAEVPHLSSNLEEVKSFEAFCFPHAMLGSHSASGEARIVIMKTSSTLLRRPYVSASCRLSLAAAKRRHDEVSEGSVHEGDDMDAGTGGVWGRVHGLGYECQAGGGGIEDG